MTVTVSASASARDAMRAGRSTAQANRLRLEPTKCECRAAQAQTLCLMGVYQPDWACTSRTWRGWPPYSVRGLRLLQRVCQLGVLVEGHLRASRAHGRDQRDDHLLDAHRRPPAVFGEQLEAECAAGEHIAILDDRIDDAHERRVERVALRERDLEANARLFARVPRRVARQVRCQLASGSTLLILMTQSNRLSPTS